MAEISWQEQGQTGQIVYVEGPTAPLSTVAQFRQLLLQLQGLRVSASVVSFKLIQQDPPENYLYRFDDAAGRKFRQIITVDDPDNPLMDFTCDEWRLTEFAPHRELREQCLYLIRHHGVTRIEVTWA